MKGTGVWIGTCGRGGREGDQTTVSTETLLSGEMQTCRARGEEWGGHVGVTGQMGRLQELTL